jgi:hypothetical protein
MQRISSFRPSPSMIVALAALVIAMGGTAIAARSLVNGDRLIAKRSLSGDRLRSHTLTGKQIDLRKLGSVPTARNASALGGQPASGYAPARPLVYTNAALAGGWTQGANGHAPGFAIDPFGVVHLRGTLASGTEGTPAFDLPARMRPSAVVELPIYTLGETEGLLFIGTDGSVVPWGTNASAYTSLEGLTFSAG